jgi:hypothetical protein
MSSFEGTHFYTSRATNLTFIDLISSRFCLDNFFVGVWTTASAANATPLLEGLLSPVRKEGGGGGD